MTAGDSWADLHGTKDRPAKQFFRNWEGSEKKDGGCVGRRRADLRRRRVARRRRADQRAARVRGAAAQRRLRRGSDTARDV